jgi:kumamolisin
MSFLKRKPDFATYIRYPHANTSGYAAKDVARAYGAPVDTTDGTGVTIGVIELGGAVNPSDLAALGQVVSQDLSKVSVTSVGVAGGSPVSDGPNGADGEVALDVQVIAQIAPGAHQRVYFAPNTDAGFLAAIQQAAIECDVISVSWGGPESSWSHASVLNFSAAFAAARAKNIPVFVASGDAGAKDGTPALTADYPASDPSTIGCGGTRLVLTNGVRASEVVWDDNPTSDATGGGISKLFPNRTVPDIAANADPVTGYTVVVDGQTGVIGGTSAVAPLAAACYALVKQVTGKKFDLINVIEANPSVCWDITIGNNGGYAAGVGKDDASGWGAVSWDKVIAIVNGTSTTPTPTPTPSPTPTPTPTPTPAPTPDPDVKFWVWLRQYVTFQQKAIAYMDAELKTHGH